MHLPDLPKPILFHPLKHHLGYMRAFIRLHTVTEQALLLPTLKTIGSSQLDLYLGALTPFQIADETISYLQSHNVLEREAYGGYISSGGADYKAVVLSDGSDWVLRWGVLPERHVHLHPARYSRYTMRIKANILKTAMAVHLSVRRGGATAVDLQAVNQVRAQWLGLPPLKEYAPDEGIAKAIAMLSR